MGTLLLIIVLLVGVPILLWAIGAFWLAGHRAARAVMFAPCVVVVLIVEAFFGSLLIDISQPRPENGPAIGVLMLILAIVGGWLLASLPIYLRKP
jgi:hypothetical protein